MKKKLLIWLLAIVMGGAAIGGAGYYYREPIKNAANHCYQQIFHKNSGNVQETEPTPEPEDNAVVTRDEEYVIQLQEKQLRINTLETAIADLNQTIGELNTANDAYSARLADLTARKTELEAQVAELQDTNAAITAEKQAEIDALNLSLADLQSEIDTLNANNAEQLAELTNRKTELENQVTKLQGDIETLTTESQAAIGELNATITGLNDRIQELENANTEYAALIENYETIKVYLETQVTALQAQVDELQGRINELELAAPKRLVLFIVDDTVYSTQIIDDGKTAELPELPKKTGYVFKGWKSRTGDLCDSIDTTPITEDTVYFALFGVKQLKWVETHMELFSYNDGGETAELCDLPSGFNTYNTWEYSGITYYSNGAAQYYWNSSTHRWHTIEWYGLASDVISDGGIYGQYVWVSPSNKVYYSRGTKQYVLNMKTRTWSKVDWYYYNKGNGYIIGSWFGGRGGSMHIYNNYIFSNGYYVSEKNMRLYRLNPENDYERDPNFNPEDLTFERNMASAVKLYGHYYLNNAVLNEDTLEWNEVEKFSNEFSYYNKYFWEYDGVVYYSYGTRQYLLNETTLRFEPISWNDGISPIRINILELDGKVYLMGDTVYELTEVAA